MNCEKCEKCFHYDEAYENDCKASVIFRQIFCKVSFPGDDKQPALPFPMRPFHPKKKGEVEVEKKIRKPKKVKTEE